MKNGDCAKRKNVKNRNKKGLNSKKEFKSKNSDVCKNRYAGKRRTVGNRQGDNSARSQANTMREYVSSGEDVSVNTAIIPQN